MNESPPPGTLIQHSVHGTGVVASREDVERAWNPGLWNAYFDRLWAWWSPPDSGQWGENPTHSDLPDDEVVVLGNLKDPVFVEEFLNGTP